MPSEDEESGSQKLGVGLQNLLNLLLSVASAIHLSFQDSRATTLRTHLKANTDLRSVDRLLIVVASTAGAVDYRLALTMVLDLVFTKACLQTFLACRMFDFGFALNEGIDPAAETSLATYAPPLGGEEQLASIQCALEAIRSQLRQCLQHLAGSDDGPLPLDLERDTGLSGALQRLVTISQDAMVEAVRTRGLRLRVPSGEAVWSLPGIERGDPQTRQRVEVLCSAALIGSQADQMMRASPSLLDPFQVEGWTMLAGDLRPDLTVAGGPIK